MTRCSTPILAALLAGLSGPGTAAPGEAPPPAVGDAEPAPDGLAGGAHPSGLTDRIGSEPAPRVTLESLLAAQPARPIDGMTLAVGGEDGPFKLTFSGYAQFRYTGSIRQDPPDGNELTHGFSVRRAEAQIQGHVGSPRFRYKVKFDTRGNGTNKIEETVFTWAIDDRTSITFGQFRMPFVQEVNIGGRHQVSVDRSRVAAVFGQGFPQGILVTHQRERVRGRFEFSDGIQSINTDFVNPAEADAALTGRLDLRFGDRTWSDFDRFVSFPGSERGAMVGVAGHFETRGDTGLGAPLDRKLYQLTTDASIKGPGWSSHAAFHWRRIVTPGMSATDDLGLLVQATRFISDQDEIFARWDTVWPSGDRPGPADPFSTLTVGLKHFFIPESNALTAIFDVQYLFDDFDGSASLIGTSTTRGQIIDNEDGQIALRVQFQMSF